MTTKRRRSDPPLRTRPSLPRPGSAASLPPPDATHEIVRVPVLAEGADPGRTTPSPLAVRDRVLVDRDVVGGHVPERLFAYEVTAANLRHLRGVASPGDRIVFRRGGAVAPDRVCAVRTERGVVLSRVRVEGRVLVLLPGEGGAEAETVELTDVKALPGVIAGTHVLLIRH